MEKNELLSIVGRNLQRCRANTGLTQEQIAEQAGISTSFYANLERGNRCMSALVLRDLADALGVSADSLLGEADAWPPVGGGLSGTGSIWSPFSYAERNARKKQLLINTLAFELHNVTIYDEFGDEYPVNRYFSANRLTNVLTMTKFDADGVEQSIVLEKKQIAKLLRWVIHTLEIFMWEEDYDLSPDDPYPDVPYPSGPYLDLLLEYWPEDRDEGDEDGDERTRLRLFLDWGITFGKAYQTPEYGQRKVHYADRRELEEAIRGKYPPPKADAPRSPMHRNATSLERKQGLHKESGTSSSLR